MVQDGTEFMVSLDYSLFIIEEMKMTLEESKEQPEATLTAFLPQSLVVLFMFSFTSSRTCKRGHIYSWFYVKKDTLAKE
jgi:hypothetical protein